MDGWREEGQDVEMEGKRTDGGQQKLYEGVDDKRMVEGGMDRGWRAEGKMK